MTVEELEQLLREDFYCSDRIEGPIYEELEQLREALRYDHVFAKFTSNRRSNGNFQYADLLVLVKEWPEAESNWSVKNMRESMSKNQELEKLVKLELELNRLRAWNPEKTSDVKKKEAALAALRAKAERFSKSKVASVQGEAMSIISDIDNPPQPAAQ